MFKLRFAATLAANRKLRWTRNVKPKPKRKELPGSRKTTRPGRNSNSASNSVRMKRP